jgi:hypothetical protein
MATVTMQTDTEMQNSGKTAQGDSILAVLAKRTYSFGPDGLCHVADDQVPLFQEPQYDPDNPDVLLHDLDLYTFKPMTDVVVKGHVFGREQRNLEVAVRVGRHEKRISVFGDRSCALSATGQLLFSKPQPIDEIPLSYTHAYGGRDSATEQKHGNPVVDFFEGLDPDRIDLSNASPFLYPRNACGRGYLVETTKESVEALQLPNLEDPSDLLSPDRLSLDGIPDNWPQMPLPQATDWFAYEWFPRIAYFGLTPYLELDDDELITEVARGYAPSYITEERAPDADSAFRAACGASLGLQLPYLAGDEIVELVNLDPKQSCIRFQLPAVRPLIWTDGREGKLNETNPVVHTVVIEPDESRLSIVWRGSTPALRPYLPEELEKMPFRVEW